MWIRVCVTAKQKVEDGKHLAIKLFSWLPFLEPRSAEITPFRIKILPECPPLGWNGGVRGSKDKNNGVYACNRISSY
ncbi:hypothetical protein CEXT_138401 [Caerostris extrusa]|uniref:Uncharacterized protein n=1 Tax=Caerostris extrusa TaxID=172846 RepID=A0AAV4VNB5_CAEEX|nr:hypothetical protein CEXT_138401 [Caerostris extrusa]